MEQCKCGIKVDQFDGHAKSMASMFSMTLKIYLNLLEHLGLTPTQAKDKYRELLAKELLR